MKQIIKNTDFKNNSFFFLESKDCKLPVKIFGDTNKDKELTMTLAETVITIKKDGTKEIKTIGTDQPDGYDSN